MTQPLTDETNTHAATPAPEPEAPVPGAETAAEPSNAPESPEASETGGRAARDAARYRVQLRETEAALETTRGQLAALQSAEVHRLAGERLEVPEDLLTLSGKAVADFLADDGTVNAEAVQAAVADVLAARPGLRRPDPAIDPSQGQADTYGLDRRAPSWSDVLAFKN